MTLADIRPGQKCIVLKITKQNNNLRKRLIDMGITIGTIIYVRKYAPFGDPIEINLRGYELSLRKKDAYQIEVKKYFT